MSGRSNTFQQEKSRRRAAKTRMSNRRNNTWNNHQLFLFLRRDTIFTREQMNKQQHANYLELKVPIRQNAVWFVKLREAMAAAHIPVKWQNRGTYHITVAFIKGDEQVEALRAAFERHLNDCDAPSLTFDEVNVFEAKNEPNFIVNLTSSRPSPEFVNFVDTLRQEISTLDAEIESEFKLHVTLGRIDVASTSLEEVKKLADSIQVPPFTLLLKDANYRYYQGGVIHQWKMKNNNHSKKHHDMTDYRKINYTVMWDTITKITHVPELRSALDYSIAHQYMVMQEENIDQPVVKDSQTQYITSGKRSFEAAKAYKGKKTAVLNFANNHSVGGAPFSAGAQEESLCRCSTLFPCLEALKEPFYKKHSDDYTKGLINAMGNDDLIYTPDVVVFKTDERTDPIYPQMMEPSDWYKVDVITCAAPELMKMRHRPENYEEVITSRVKKILDVAAKEKVEVLILGAWGCGAFKNDAKVVSKAFFTLLKNYNFEIVEFALASHGDVSESPFVKH